MDERFHHGGRPVPAVTADEMRDVDRAAVEDLDLGLEQMMENAGRSLAATALELAGGPAGEGTDPSAGEGTDPILVLAGAGGNGGGGIAAARHLYGHGRAVRVVCDRLPADLSGVPARQARTLAATPVPVEAPPADPVDLAGAAADAPLVVDALIGYGLRSAPRGTAAGLIEAAGAADRTLSLDVPSGVDATTGERPGVAVAPDRTLTLALPKTGLADVPGELSLADLGIPPVAFERAGVEYESPFDEEWVVGIEAA